jgi:glycosyltransferase involved in cell wall biosynthesis
MNVSMGVNLEALPAEQPTRPRDPLRFGFMGGFQPNKGIWDLLDAAAVLKREGLDFELHIWGPGQEAADEAVAERDLGDRVVLHGMYEGAGVWAAYALIDVALIPTTVPEPFGRIPLEAAAAGAPTIGARAGGIQESIRHGVNGLLHGFRDVADLTRQMRRMLEEPGLYERLREGLSVPVDTRSRAVAAEDAYLALLADAGIEPKEQRTPVAARSAE